MRCWVYGTKKMESKIGRKNKFINKSESLFSDEMDTEDLEACDAKKGVSSKIQHISLALIGPGEYQPRREFNDVELVSLAESIMTHGVMQPIVVRPIGKGGMYEIIAGERRWRASKIAHLTSIPSIVRDDISDKNALALGLIENIQRKNLNAIEEAVAFSRLMDEFMMTHEKISETVGKSRASITNTLRLLRLPKVIQSAVANGTVQAGHAKALLSLPESGIIDAFDYLLKSNLSVRDLEGYVRKILGEEGREKKKVIFLRVSRDESRLQDLALRLFGRECSVNLGKNGFVKIPFNLDDADDMINMLESLLEPRRD
jgi:ParB family chromosome partitioning protein